MHPGSQQQQRRGNPTRMPMMYSNSLPPGPLLPAPTLRYGGGLGTYQQPTSGIGGMKHHQPRGGNRGGRNSTITHRQQRPIANSRYHPYPFRQPLPPQQQRPYRPPQVIPRTPAALMGTPPGMSQSEYELIHSAQVQRDKKKLDVLAPSNTTQFLINDHNRQTPSTIATPTPTHQTNSSPSTTHTQPSLPYDQMFEMNEVDAQSDDAGSIQDFGLGSVDPLVDDDFNDIYYQCRYERYAAFSRANLLKEVLSLCANIDRLQYEKSEVEKRLRDVQQHLYNLTSGNNEKSEGTINDEIAQTTEEEDSRMQSPIPQATNSSNPDEVIQPSISLEANLSEDKATNEENTSEQNGNEQQIVHD